MTLIGEEFERRVAEWSDIQGHLAFMSDLVDMRNPAVVVELGARSGYSTVALLNGLEGGDGHLYSVDIDTPQWPEFVWSHPQLTFIQGDDLEVRAQVPQEIDVLFIDTSHHYDQTLSELRLYGESARVVLMHDTELELPWQAPPAPLFPVLTALNVWSLETGRDFYCREGSYGMAVVE